MEENQKFDGFGNQSFAPEYAPGYAPDAVGMQSADMGNMTGMPTDEGSKNGKKGKKEKKSKKGTADSAADFAPVEGKEGTDKKGKQDKKPVDPELKKIYNRKTTVLTSYFVALLCLIAGLVVPLFNFVDGVAIGDMLMFKYIPDMFNHMFGQYLNIPIFAPFKPMPDGVTAFTCVIGILYAAITVVAIGMFIPILLCGIGKKNKKTGATAALIVEIIAVLITAAYVAYTTYTIVINNSGAVWRDYNFFIPLGGVLLMAIFQVITAKKGLGVSKTIAVLLSALGVFALLDFATFITQIEGFVDNIAAQFDINAGFISGLELATSNRGIDGFNIILHITSFWNTIMASELMIIIVYVFFVLATAFTLLNLVVDVLGLATGRLTKKDYRETEITVRDKDNNIVKDRNGKDKVKKVKTEVKAEMPWNNPASNTFAIVRYILTIVFLGAILAIGFLFKDGNDYYINIGVYFYLLLGIEVLSLLNASIRFAVANSRRNKFKKKMLKEERESRNNYNFAGAEQYGNQPYGYPANYYGYGQPQQPYNAYAQQQPAYDPYANQQQQPAYDPYANQQPAPAPAYQEPAYQAPVAEQTNFSQEQPVQEQQTANPYYGDYAQGGYDGYANAAPAQTPVNDYQAPVYQEPAPVNDYQAAVYQEPTPAPAYQEPAYQAPAYQAPAYQEPAYQTPAYQEPTPAPAYQQPAAAPVYQQPVQVQNPFDISLDETPEEPIQSNYAGPTDAFMNTLNDDEKNEFLEVFVNKTRGAVKGIPDYVIGEDNSEFFPMVFVHINRYRNSVSDGLMSKLYKQLIK